MSESPVASPPATAGAPTTPAAAPDVLATIVAATRRTTEVRRELRPARVLESEARNARPNGAAFTEGLSRTDRFNVIAECKRRSPSRGVLRDFGSQVEPESAEVKEAIEAALAK